MVVGIKSQHLKRSVSPSAAATHAACPCGSGLAYAVCCGSFHTGEIPLTAEALMRSRYSAYVMGDAPYIAATWHPSKRDAGVGERVDQSSSPPLAQWIDLTILHTESAGERATVEFVARYKTRGRAQRLHEVSRFIREQGRWFYVDGSFPSPEKS